MIPNESKARIFEKRKCVKSGGTFYEHAGGKKSCWPAIAIKDKSKTVLFEVMKGNISKRKKCLLSGGVWATNSEGSMCYKKLK